MKLEISLFGGNEQKFDCVSSQIVERKKICPAESSDAFIRLIRMVINKVPSRIFVVLSIVVQLTLLKHSLDILNHQIEMDPAIEHQESEQESKMVDDFYSYVTQPADGRSFRDHSHASRHSESCAFRVQGIRTPCSCCAGAMTFQKAENLVNGIFQPLPPNPVTVADNEKSPLTSTGKIQRIPLTTMLGIFNIARMFGFGNNNNLKPALNASFGTGEDASGEGSRHGNVLWGTNGVIPRTFKYWREGIMSMYSEICRLRAEVCKWRTKAREEKLKRKALEEKHKAEEERLKETNKALEVRQKQLEEALKRAEECIQSRARVRALASRFNAAMADKRAGGGGAMDHVVAPCQASSPTQSRTVASTVKMTASVVSKAALCVTAESFARAARDTYRSHVV